MTHATDPRRVTLYTWIISVGGFLFGYDTGIINGALPFLQQDFTLSPAAEGGDVRADPGCRLWCVPCRAAD